MNPGSFDAISVVIETAIAVFLSAFAGWVVTTLRDSRRKQQEYREQQEALREADEKKQEDLRAGFRAVLYTELYRLWDKHVANGEPMTYEDWLHVEELNRAYIAVDGNSFGGKFYEELIDIAERSFFRHRGDSS